MAASRATDFWVSVLLQMYDVRDVTEKPVLNSFAKESFTKTKGLGKLETKKTKGVVQNAQRRSVNSSLMTCFKLKPFCSKEKKLGRSCVGGLC